MSGIAPKSSPIHPNRSLGGDNSGQRAAEISRRRGSRQISKLEPDVDDLIVLCGWTKMEEHDDSEVGRRRGGWFGDLSRQWRSCLLTVDSRLKDEATRSSELWWTLDDVVRGA